MEIQTSLRSGVPDSHLLELIELATSVASTFVDYAHEHGLIL